LIIDKDAYLKYINSERLKQAEKQLLKYKIELDTVKNHPEFFSKYSLIDSQRKYNSVTSLVESLSRGVI